MTAPAQFRAISQSSPRNALLVAAALRIALMLAAYLLTGTQVITQGDTASYLEPGRNLLLHGAYTGSGLPEIDRTPGYPIFLMLTGMVVNNALLSVLAQIAVSLASLLLVYRIARQVFPAPGVASTAAWLYAFEPISVLYTVRLMPETLFVLFLLAAVERLIRFQQTARLTALATAGGLLAAATYVRPVGYYLAFPLAIALALTAPKVRGLWWKSPAVLLLTTMPLLAIWQVRNAIETGYTGFSSIVEKNLYFYQSAELTAELNHMSLGDQQKQLGYLNEAAYLRLHPEQQNWSQAERLRYMHTESLRILAQHRLLYLKTHIAGVAVVAFTPCATELLQLLNAYPKPEQMPRRILNEGVLRSIERVVQNHPAVTAAMVLLEAFLCILYLLALRGIQRNRQSKLAILTLTGIALYFLLISGGAQAIGRYRLPIMPIVCIFAAAGITPLRTNKNAEP